MLVTLGISFIIADLCLLVWTGDPWTVPAPPSLRPPLLIAGYAFPTYRLVVLGIALVAAVALYLLMDRTRLGAMIRAGVDDMEMARGVGIPVSLLFTIVFLLGAVLAGAAGALGGPILNAYPGLDTDMLPLALIVVILGGAGTCLALSSAASWSAFFTILASRCFPTSPISSCSCRWCWCWCSCRRACSEGSQP